MRRSCCVGYSGYTRSVARMSSGVRSGDANGSMIRTSPNIWLCCKSSVSSAEQAQDCAAATMSASHHERVPFLQQPASFQDGEIKDHRSPFRETTHDPLSRTSVSAYARVSHRALEAPGDLHVRHVGARDTQASHGCGAAWRGPNCPVDRPGRWRQRRPERSCNSSRVGLRPSTQPSLRGFLAR